MKEIIIFSVLSFIAGWLLSGAISVEFMERKFRAWLRMNDYDEKSIERSVEEMKGIIL